MGGKGGGTRVFGFSIRNGARARVYVCSQEVIAPLRRSLNLSFPHFCLQREKRTTRQRERDRREEKSFVRLCRTTRQRRLTVNIKGAFQLIRLCMSSTTARDSRVDNAPLPRDHLSQWRARGIWHYPRERKKGRCGREVKIKFPDFAPRLNLDQKGNVVGACVNPPTFHDTLDGILLFLIPGSRLFDEILQRWIFLFSFFFCIFIFRLFLPWEGRRSECAPLIN